MSVESIIRNALREDIGSGDITTKAIIPLKLIVKAEIIVKEDAIVCGLGVAQDAFKLISKKIRFKALKKSGQSVKKGARIALVSGSAADILKGERVALNFISRLSGIATLTSEFVKKVKGTKALILDTRKTTPNLRSLERCAVRCGGGVNHRFGLFDQVLIKDNHLQCLKKQRIKRIIETAKNTSDAVIEVEVKNPGEFIEAILAKPDIILLDNFNIADIKKAMRIKKDLGINALIEVSGGVSLANVTKIAKTGVDRISIGALTHSAKSIDFSLDIL